MRWAEQLAARAQEAVRVGVLTGPNVLIVHHVFRPDNSVQILEVGAAIPWHACAIGKAIAANVDAERLAELEDAPLPRLTGNTITAKRSLDADLKRARMAGVALDDQEAIVGEAGIAAAVFDHRGTAVGAMGVTGAVERILPDGPDPDMVGAVKEAARGLSRELGAGRLGSGIRQT
jgi:DNA-binding IclR family transcriptional regulator